MARIAQKLTDNKIKNAKITDENDRLYDGDGLHLFISKNVQNFGGLITTNLSLKRTEMSLGKYPEVSLA